MAILLTRGQAQKLQKFMNWSIKDMQHRYINPGNYSPELKEGMELQELIKEKMEADFNGR